MRKADIVSPLRDDSSSTGPVTTLATESASIDTSGRLCRRQLPSTGQAILFGLLAACATPGSLPPENAVDQALQRFAQAMRDMDNTAIAALYAEDAEVSHDDGKPIRGAKAIFTFLESFRAFKVREYRITPSETSADALHARQAGRYRQKVTLPDGNTVEVGGRFAADWIIDENHRWRIRRMATYSQ